MKRVLIYCLMLGFVLLYSCELDNYEPPTMTIEGKVVDEVTGENIYTQQPNGIKIRLLEEGFTTPTPYDFWAMSDGTFRTTKVFPAKFKDLALEGPFEDASVEQMDVDVTGSNKTIEFQVVPYARIKNVNITVNGTTVKATYNIERTTSTKVPKSSLLMIHQSVILHITTTGLKKSAVNNLTSLTPEVLAARTFEDQITGLTPGTYYARVGVLTDNYLNRYTYSPIVQIVILAN
jgi:hypothetical protein